MKTTVLAAALLAAFSMPALACSIHEHDVRRSGNDQRDNIKPERDAEDGDQEARLHAP